MKGATKAMEPLNVAFVAAILVAMDVSASAVRRRSPVKSPWRHAAKGR